MAASRAAKAQAPATKPIAATEQCANDVCHATIMNRQVMHGPTAQKKCLACHQYDEPREHRFKLAGKEGQLCGDCHTLKDRTVVHTPVKQGRCTGCHDPHGSDHRAMLVADPTRGLCLTCHKQADFTQKKFIHGPVASGACILCHESHSAWEQKLLVERPEKLCVSCHTEMVPTGDKARHVHPPAKDNCVGCHDSHASDFRQQLRQAAPELCLSCHKEMEQVLAKSHVVHKAATDADGCTTCHTSHFSQLPKLQRESQPQMCLTCHNKALKTADGKTLPDMAAMLKEHPQHHGPIREGDCTVCHQPHAGERFRLLAADYPPLFYSPFQLEQYGLCFKCHIPELVLKKDGTGLTGFRKGDLNLHWLHVNQEKGRTCRACHEVHASKRPFHIRESVPFGDKGWMLEIDYKQTPTGGTCSPGCHKTQSYDHGGNPKGGLLPTTRETKNERAAK